MDKSKKGGGASDEDDPENLDDFDNLENDWDNDLDANEEDRYRKKDKKEKKEESEVTDDGYLFAKIPWSLSVSYSLRYGAGSQWDEKKNYYKMEFRHNLSFSASIGLGSGWKASTSLSYDVNAKKLSYTSINVSRDLHCWSMSASFVPFGPYKSYTFHIGVNASMLKDLKYDTSSADATGRRIEWW
jgi:hypothetical protein